MDEHDYHSNKGASTYSKGVPNALKSMYTKKVPKDILEMNDDLSKKYIKQASHLSKQFTK